MKNILVTSYGVNPYRDEKSSAAWNLILQASRNNRLTVVTSQKNKQHIRQYLDSNRKQRTLQGRIDVRCFDLPAVFNFLYQHRTLRPLFYYIWQLGVALHLLGKTGKTDICHDLNMYPGLVPSFLWILGKPFVWGPVTAPVKPGKDVLQHESEFRKFVWNLNFFCCKLRWNVDPFMLLCRLKAERILYANEEAMLPLRRSSSKLEFLPISGSEIPVMIPVESNEFRLVSFGDRERIGSHDLFIRAFHSFYCNLTKENQAKVSLTVVSNPADVLRISELVASLSLSRSVHLETNLSRFSKNQLLQHATAVMVSAFNNYAAPVAEALSFGLPVVCKQAGAGAYVNPMSRLKIQSAQQDNAIQELSVKLKCLFESEKFLNTERKLAGEQFFRYFRWASKRVQLENIYEKVLGHEIPGFEAAAA